MFTLDFLKLRIVDKVHKNFMILSRKKEMENYFKEYITKYKKNRLINLKMNILLENR